MKIITTIYVFALALLIVACTTSGKAIQPALDKEGATESAIEKSICYDSDGGMEFSIKGHVNGKQNDAAYDHEDTCLSRYTVKEWYCQRTIPKYITYNCQYQNTECKDGACINIRSTTRP